MANKEEQSPPSRDSILSVDSLWWPAAFWLFIGQLVLEAVIVVYRQDGLSDMNLFEQARFIRSELSDDVLISAVIAIGLVDSWRYILITAGWLQRRIERHEAKRLEEALAEELPKAVAEALPKAVAEAVAEALPKAVAEARAEVLAVLDEDVRKDAERKLGLNGSPDSTD